MTNVLRLKDCCEVTDIKTEYGTDIMYECNDTDCWGDFWVYRDAEGARCVVTARTWEAAWGLVMDTLPTIPSEEIVEAYGFYGKTAHDEMHAAFEAAEEGKRDYPELQEGYRYQDNASGSGIVSYSLNGEYLEPLTGELLRRLGWIINIERVW